MIITIIIIIIIKTYQIKYWIYYLYYYTNAQLSLFGLLWNVFMNSHFIIKSAQYVVKTTISKTIIYFLLSVWKQIY